MAGFTISSARRTASNMVVYGLVTDHLQRMWVMVPYKFATTDQATAIIEHAIEGLDRPTKPLGVH